MSDRRQLVRTKHDWPQAGEWRPLGTKAVVGCPGCGETATLTDHEIRDDGTVHPSLVCPFAVCNFHEWVRLDGWRAPHEGGAE